MPTRLPATIPLIAAALATGLTSVASAAATGPSDAQIRSAVRHAEHSSTLWATINMCNLPSTNPPGDRVVGVRMQMPALGFSTELFMGTQLYYWSQGQKRFRPLPKSQFHLRSVGKATHLAHQSGATFTLKPPGAGTEYVLRAVATFEWRIGKRVLAHVQRVTGHGYKHVDFSRPPGYTAGTCTITPTAQPASAANRRGSLLITPVTPSASSARIRGSSSTVHT